MSKLKLFGDYDLKKMAEQGFKSHGWQNYSDSPYKEYRTVLEQLGYGEEKENTDNTGYQRSDR